MARGHQALTVIKCFLGAAWKQKAEKAPETATIRSYCQNPVSPNNPTFIVHVTGIIFWHCKKIEELIWLVAPMIYYSRPRNLGWSPNPSSMSNKTNQAKISLRGAINDWIPEKNPSFFVDKILCLCLGAKTPLLACSQFCQLFD